MAPNCEECIPEPLLDDILTLAVGADERYLRPISTMSKQLHSISNRLRKTLKITPNNAHCIDKLLKRFPNIKHINLPFFYDPVRFFVDIWRFNISLESLDLSLMRTFPIKRLKNMPLSTIQPTLRSLKLSYVQDQDDVSGDLETLAELFPNLEELELFWRYKVSHNGVARLSVRLKRLRKITFAGHYMVTDATLKMLVQNCLELEEIVLNHCENISPRGISYVFRHCRKLRSFVLQEMYDLGSGAALPLARNLTSLEFSSMIVSDEFLRAVSKAKIPLRRIALVNCKVFTLQGVLFVLGAYHYQLEYFAIESQFSKRQLRPEAIEHIAPYLWNAKTVKLNYCCGLSTRRLIGLIYSCLKARTLEIKGYSVSMDRDQAPFTLQCEKRSQLRSLSLSFSESLSDLGLAMASRVCPYLTHLFVNGCKAITKRGLSQITRNCHGLKTLQMNGCDGVFGLGLEVKVSGYYYKLEVLEARGSSLGDECLKAIASRCPDMMCIDVTDCQFVTGVGLLEVAMRCRNLERLGVSFKYVDPDAEFVIRSKRPWLVDRCV